MLWYLELSLYGISLYYIWCCWWLLPRDHLSVTKLLLTGTHATNCIWSSCSFKVTNKNHSLEHYDFVDDSIIYLKRWNEFIQYFMTLIIDVSLNAQWFKSPHILFWIIFATFFDIFLQIVYLISSLFSSNLTLGYLNMFI